MDFEDDLNAILPGDLPNRDNVVQVAAHHLRLIVEANASMNLTRIVTPREAAIKHVLDSVIPWRLVTGVQILDAGTGAGFPGVPLAATLPSVRFALSESIGKKARFVKSALENLNMINVSVSNSRAEVLCLSERYETILARAVAPISRLSGWIAPACRNGARALLYKGPDVDREISEAAAELKKYRLKAQVVMRYELPEGMGSRTIVELTSV